MQVPGELQRGQCQSHQAQATAALHVWRGPGWQEQEPHEQQRAAERHKWEVDSGPKQTSHQQAHRHTPQWAFTERRDEGIGLVPGMVELTTPAVPAAWQQTGEGAPRPTTSPVV